MIEINEDNAHVKHGCKDHVIKIKNECELSKVTWIDEIGETLSKRNIEIEEENEKVTKKSVNKTIMDYVVQYVEKKKCSKMLLPPTNQIRLRKRMMYPFELVGIRGRSNTLDFR